MFRDAKKSHNAQLRAACESALAEIKQLITAEDDGGLPSAAAASSKTANDDSGGDSVSVSSFVVSSSSVLPDPSEMSRLNADKYFLPFDLACQSKSARLTVIALDGIQKLIAYGHLTGEQPSSVNGGAGGRRLIDDVVETICACFSGLQTDEGVQLQILKVGKPRYGR